ncbi:pyruvate kinase [Balneicella halophila]|uniref:Pyruvate kinase n=1 Tax=Balneicella halophila TaxID=1537566 RepID=A0A7L4UQT4_BALHA|nr:pyruvate kinase [Balneicella halophila]PVX51801.1 pyruvate kinase [Balneicella halophila]
MRKTKIVCTIGPASNDKNTFKQLVEAGLDVARLNFSHGDHDTHKELMDMIKEVRSELNKPIGILLDTKGPEIRLGEVEPDTILIKGEPFILTPEEVLGNHKKVQINYDGLHETIKPGNRILIDDGLVGLRVNDIHDNEIHTVVEFGGKISTKKGVNTPGVKLNLPAMTAKDKSDILFGLSQDIDFIAASFIRKADDVLAIRKLLEENNHTDVQIISKIENEEGYANIDEILDVSDGIMVARGDLGVEIPFEEVPIAQKSMIKKCNMLGKPVITATQMLDSMMRNPSPTRAEAADVANAIYDGTDAIMLSGETAAGSYPVKSVETMAIIAERTERSLSQVGFLSNLDRHPFHDSVTFTVSQATVNSAYHLGAKCILLITTSGFTARRIAMHRPSCMIIAVTPYPEVRRQLALVWGVTTLLLDELGNDNTIYEKIENCALKSKLVEFGDLAVIASGVPIGISGATNTMRVRALGAFYMKGLGIGKGKHTAPVRIINSLNDAKTKIQEGDIIYSDILNESYAPYIKLAGAIITKESRYTSYAAFAGRTLKIPVVVGLKNILDFLVDGNVICVNASSGMVHNSSKELS